MAHRKNHAIKVENSKGEVSKHDEQHFLQIGLDSQSYRDFPPYVAASICRKVIIALFLNKPFIVPFTDGLSRGHEPREAAFLRFCSFIYHGKSTAMALIKVENLTFSYPSSYDEIFSKVNFQIDTDWKLGFVGRNGRGKTTFLNLLRRKYNCELKK